MSRYIPLNDLEEYEIIQKGKELITRLHPNPYSKITFTNQWFIFSFFYKKEKEEILPFMSVEAEPGLLKSGEKFYWEKPIKNIFGRYTLDNEILDKFWSYIDMDKNSSRNRALRKRNA